MESDMSSNFINVIIQTVRKRNTKDPKPRKSGGLSYLLKIQNRKSCRNLNKNKPLN